MKLKFAYWTFFLLGICVWLTAFLLNINGMDEPVIIFAVGMLTGWFLDEIIIHYKKFKEE